MHVKIKTNEKRKLKPQGPKMEGVVIGCVGKDPSTIKTLKGNLKVQVH